MGHGLAYGPWIRVKSAKDARSRLLLFGPRDAGLRPWAGVNEREFFVWRPRDAAFLSAEVPGVPERTPRAFVVSGPMVFLGLCLSF
jgi:hypothetical protein